LQENVVNVINEPFPYKTHYSPVDLVLYSQAKDERQRDEEIMKLGYYQKVYDLKIDPNPQVVHGYIIADSFEFV